MSLALSLGAGIVNQVISTSLWFRCVGLAMRAGSISEDCIGREINKLRIPSVTTCGNQAGDGIRIHLALHRLRIPCTGDCAIGNRIRSVFREEFRESFAIRRSNVHHVGTGRYWFNAPGDTYNMHATVEAGSE